MKLARSLFTLASASFFLCSASSAQVVLACPGGNAAIQISDARDSGQQIRLGYCSAAECRAAIAQLEAGKTVILRDSEDRWVRIEPIGNGLFRATVQFAETGYPTDTQILQGTLSLGGGMRGGCGSEIEIMG